LTRVVETSHATLLIAAFVLYFASSADAFAWGYAGHRIIAEIAEQLLEPETARQVRDLLAIENTTTLADVSTWADQIRLQRPETAPWHYVNIVPDQQTPDPVSVVPAHVSIAHR
jgi:S1/P1 Nuclease